MNRSFLDDLPIDIPDYLKNAAYDLRPQGIGELAWLYPTVLDVIGILAAHGLAILGGDVYRQGKQSLVNTGDNWYVPANSGMPWDVYVREAAQRAISYIETYDSRHGPGFWFSLVFAHNPALD